MSITAFVPCRKGSQRIPNKNIKPFLDYKYGLLEIKINQLIKCDKIDKIILSTNDEYIIGYMSKINSNRVEIDIREDALSNSCTSTDELIDYAGKLISNSHILWTHVTSPFINNDEYEKIINKYFDVLNRGYDSLMTVTKSQTFLWDENGPVNYDKDEEKWPRTQTIAPYYEVNSGVFLSHSENYSLLKDRVGINPYLYELDSLVSHDIDWPNDFVLAELMLEKKLVRV